MAKISDIGKYFGLAIGAFLGSGITVVPHVSVDALDLGALAEVTTLVIQGPKVEKDETDMDVRSTKISQVDDIVKNEIITSRERVDLVYRLRLFDNLMVTAQDWVQEIIKMSMALPPINVMRSEITISFSGNDPVNINILKHGLETGEKITVSASTDEAALANAEYEITFVDRDNLTVIFNGTGAGGTCSVLFIDEVFDFIISSNMESDTVPNFSDLIHFEGAARINYVEIEPDSGQDVTQAKEALHLESEKLPDTGEEA